MASHRHRCAGCEPTQAPPPWLVGSTVALADWLVADGVGGELVQLRLDVYADPEWFRAVLALRVRRHNASYTLPVLPADELHAQWVDRLVARGEAQGNIVALGRAPGRWSMAATVLKLAPWEAVRLRAGAERFARLVLGCDVFVGHHDGWWQVCGVRPVLGGAGPQAERVAKRFLYSPWHRARWLDPIPGNAEAVVRAIDGTAARRLPKRLRPLRDVCVLVVRRHGRCDYLRLARLHCAGSAGGPEGACATPTAEVVRFVLLAVTHVFPLAVFGTRANRSVVYGHLARYLVSAKHQLPLLHTVASGVELGAVEWLGKSRRCTSRQDHVARLQLWRRLVRWLAEEYVLRLVAAFFHATEALLLPQVVFFRHRAWHRRVQAFWPGYRDKFLRANHCASHTAALGTATRLHGRCRLLPKRDTFRVICVPSRRDRNGYARYLQDQVAPVRAVLMALRRRHLHTHPPCGLVADVAARLLQFRRQLVLAHGRVPGLWYVKFDVRECYDTLPRGVAVSVVSEMVGSRVFVVRVVERVQGNRRRWVQVVEEPGSAPADQSGGLVLVDTARTVRVGSSDVLRVVASQMYDGAMVVGRRCYGRKRGVFQGMPLLGCLCECVYDHLTERYFGGLAPRETCVVRLADDFLVVLVRREVAEWVWAQVHSRFQLGGATIHANRDKTATNLHTARPLEFVGLGVSQQLVVLVGEDGGRRAAGPLLAAAAFRSRLVDGLVDLEGGTAAVVGNVARVARAVARAVRGPQRLAVARALAATAAARVRQVNPGAARAAVLAVRVSCFRAAYGARG